MPRGAPQPPTPATQHPQGQHPPTPHPSSARPPTLRSPVQQPLATHPQGQQLAAAHPQGQQPLAAHPQGQQPLAAHPQGQQLAAAHPQGQQPLAAHPQGQQLAAAHPQGQQPPVAHPQGQKPPAVHPQGQQPPAVHPQGQQPPAPQGQQPPAVHPQGQQPAAAHPQGQQPPAAHPQGQQPPAPQGQQPPAAHPQGQHPPTPHPSAAPSVVPLGEALKNISVSVPSEPEHPEPERPEPAGRPERRPTPANSSSSTAASDGRLATDKTNNLALLKLMERTGYNIIQENGQRKYGGPPPNWQGPPPAKGSEVFVGKIPRDLFEDELAPVFERVGRIYEVRLMMDFSGTNRGYAFVMFSTPAEASQAVRQLNNYEIRKGRYIGVVKSVDNCRLFVGGLPKNKVRDEIFEEMSKVTDGVVDVIVYSSVTDKSKSRGFAFVEYKNHKAAAMARRKLIPGRIQLWGQTIAVDWAEPEPDVDEETMSKVTVLYVRNLLLSTTEDQIRDAFSRAADGGVERVKKLRDFAFVHFSNRDKAARAQEKLDNTELDGSLVEVTWAKPIDKSRHDRYRAPVHCSPAVYPPPHGFVAEAPFYMSAGLGSPGSPGSGLYRSPNKQRGRGAAGVRSRGFMQPSAAAVRTAGGHRKPVEMRALLDCAPDMELVLTNPYTLKPMRNAAQILLDLCINSKLGEPHYQLLSTTKQTSQSDQIQLFMFKVTIPSLPPEYNTFQGSRLSLYPEEAKLLAAEAALSQLGVPLDNGEGPGSPPQAVMSRPMVPNSGYTTPSPNGSPAGFSGACQLMYNPYLFGKMIPAFDHPGVYDGYGMGGHHAHLPPIY